MHFEIEATSSGYRLSLVSASQTQTFEERGGHGEIEKLYAEAEKTINKLRSQQLRDIRRG